MLDLPRSVYVYIFYVLDVRHFYIVAKKVKVPIDAANDSLGINFPSHILSIHIILLPYTRTHCYVGFHIIHTYIFIYHFHRYKNTNSNNRSGSRFFVFLSCLEKHRRRIWFRSYSRIINDIVSVLCVQLLVLYIRKHCWFLNK